MEKPATTKISHILKAWPSGTVALSGWFDDHDLSRQLLQRYQKSGWLESVGYGAFVRTGDAVDLLGGLYAVQRQSCLAVHVGGRTALGMQGKAHYLELNPQKAHLFAPLAVNLPAWFRDNDWGIRPELHRTNFLPPDLGVVDLDVQRRPFSVKASGSARALMECLYLAPEKFDLVEAYQIMEGLTTLRPTVVQPLLEQCRSVKVKRLFLFMAEHARHPWVRHLDISRVKLGAGKRHLADGGVYIPKYQITVPRETMSS